MLSTQIDKGLREGETSHRVERDGVNTYRI